MSWDEVAATWDEDPMVRQYNEAAFASLGEVLRDHGVWLRRTRVLDFGCGTGLLSTRLADAGAEVVALDSSAEMITRLQQKNHAGLQAVVGHLEEVLETPPFREPFDLIVASSVCAFLPDYPAIARRLASLLNPGGLLVQWDWEADPARPEEPGLDRAAIGAALLGAELEDVTIDVGFDLTIDDLHLAPLRAVGRRPGPSHAELAAVVNGRRGAFARNLGMRFSRVNVDVVEAEVPVRDHLMQPYGMVHGGVYASIAESLCSVGAGVNVLSKGHLVVGLDNHTSFVHAVRSGTIFGRATPVHRGKRSHVWSAELRDDSGRLVARSRVCLLVLEPESHLAGETVSIRT